MSAFLGIILREHIVPYLYDLFLSNSECDEHLPEMIGVTNEYLKNIWLLTKVDKV